MNRMMRLAAIVLVLGLVPVFAGAGAAEGTEQRWLFATRFVLSGTSHDSDPEGYTIYSGLSIEGALRRDIGSRFSAELSLRSESREVDRDTGGVKAEPLGSLEVLPVTLVLQFRPWTGGRFRPYVGAGVNLSVVWEKSGFLDSYDVDPYVGPAFQFGVDVALGASAVLNLDVRFTTLTADINHGDDDFAEVKIDPMMFGIGAGFSF